MISHQLLDADLEPDRVRQIARHSARQRGVWERTLAFYLLAIRRRRLYELWGYSSFEHYVEEDLRLDERKARECLSLARALDNVPRLDRAFAEGKISWTVLCYLAPVVTPETAEEWLEAARGKTTREVRAMVRNQRRGDRPSDPRRMKPRLLRFEVDLPAVAYTKLKSALLRMDERARKRLTAAQRVEALADLVLSLSGEGEARTPKDCAPRVAIVYHSCPSCANAWIETDDGRVGLSAEVVREAEREAVPRVEAPQDPGEDAVVFFGERGEVPEEDRDPPVPLWKRLLVFGRDGHRCAICGRSQELMCHHLRSRGKGGTSDFANLLTVCRACHESIHSGLLVVRIREGGRPVAFDAEGRPLASDGDPARAISEDPILPMPAAVVIHSSTKACDKKTEHSERSEMFGFSSRDGGGGGADPRQPLAEPASLAARNPAGLAGHAVARLADIPAIVAASEFRRILPLLDWDTARKGLVLRLEREIPEELDPQEDAQAAGTASSPADRPEQPPRLVDLVGQREAVEWLEICLRAARKTGEPMDHVLLCGPAGLGKTTMARVLAGELGVRFTETSATAIRTPAHFLGDPAHLPKALRSRFPIQRDLVAYGEGEVAAIIERAAERAGDRISVDAARELAARARGNAREALRFLRAARILARASEASEISAEIALRALEHLGIDEDGLRPEERRLIAFLAQAGRPVGLRTIADALDLDERTVREVHEPALLREGWIRRTPWGRRATAKALAWAHGSVSALALSTA